MTSAVIKTVLIISLALLINSCSKMYCTTGGAKVYGCDSYNPVEKPGSSPQVLLRSQTQTKDGIEVSTTVLSDTETIEIFGLDLAKEGIQPIYMKIRNNTDQAYYLIKVSTDPYYFTPNEVATMNHVTFAIDVNKAIDSYIKDKSITRFIPPKGEISGFYYSNWDPGIKYVEVSLYRSEELKNYLFLHSVPGLKLDYHRVDFDNLYTEDQIISVESCEELLAIIREIPCCTQKKNGDGENDPLNFVLIGEPESIFGAFARQGWDVTETINVGSGWRTMKAFFTKERLRTSPMSSLYFYQRSQDIGLQKARSTIHERNHLRLWLTPYVYQGKDVWIGAISRDIGSYFTNKTKWKTAHAIDPDIDESRNYLIQDLIYSEALEEVGTIENSIEAATRDEPHFNFMSQPWYTDGHRAVFIFADEPRSLHELDSFKCDSD